nr:reverse transcriptase domain-containing protein [Tanacetum cinerariifolium]
MPPKRTSTSEALAMTQAAIRQLVVDSVATALETQEATMADADNANRNHKPREAPVVRKCSYKEFMSYQPFNFKGSEGAIGLIAGLSVLNQCFPIVTAPKTTRMHDGPRQVVAKDMNLGYYWPSMKRDAKELIRACDDCQAHASVPRLPKVGMISVTSAWPFMKWCMDIVRPLLEGPGRVRYLIMEPTTLPNGWR